MSIRPSALVALLLLCGCVAGPVPDGLALAARFVGAYDWPVSDHQLGGFSALELSSDGMALTTVSDRGHLVAATIQRADGRIVGVTWTDAVLLRDAAGNPLKTGAPADAEGLAIGSDGAAYVSFEGRHRVVSYADIDKANPLPRDPSFSRLLGNSGFEALAIDAQGRMLAIPEKSGRLTEPFPVWRYDGTWQVAFSLTRTNGFLPVGADLGPDGYLYVLERAFPGFGFASRVRRFDPASSGPQAGTVVMQSAVWKHDNLEGLSVWRDADGGIRLTMISDDNFRSIQKTELVEYLLSAQWAQ